MKPKLICPDCDGEYKEVTRIGKQVGVQWDRYNEGYYILFECPCRNRHWDYEKVI